MKTFYFLFALTLILPGQVLGQEFPVNELTKEEFIEFEKEKGTELTSPNLNMTVVLSESLYPFVNSYNLAQPIQGKRKTDSDSMIIDFEAFYDKVSQNIKYISYTITPDAMSPRQIAQELQSEGGMSAEEMQNEFAKRLEEQERNPAFQEKIVTKYESLKEQFAENGTLIENRNRSEDIVLTKIKTYKIDQATVELSLKGKDSLKTAASIDIYWQ